MERRDSIIGCVLGGAVGDALGHAREGKPVEQDFAFDGPFEISDDTQLTLATCEAIIEAGQADPARIATHFLR